MIELPPPESAKSKDDHRIAGAIYSLSVMLAVAKHNGESIAEAAKDSEALRAQFFRIVSDYLVDK